MEPEEGGIHSEQVAHPTATQRSRNPGEVAYLHHIMPAKACR